MGEIASICLVSSGHIGSNPRLVKEADALLEEGYRVHVIAADSHPAARLWDASILEHAKWSSSILPMQPGRMIYRIRRLIQAGCRALFSLGWRSGKITARAHHVLAPSLRSTALAVRADLYIGH